ncbi:TPA: hypothetical protein MH648_26400 [Klebsiella pneumoniae]|nr:hypothetical protein [Klebsiella pneumoniae]
MSVCTGGRLSYQYWLNGYIRHWVYAYVSVCSSVKIKGRDCGTINGHDESSSILALMKDAREALVR